jgi:hypothetical protein
MPQTVLIAVLMTVLWTMTAAAAPAITCGATLGPGGVYTLTGDLTCPEGVPGLTLLSHVTLDLGGYTLSVAGGVLLYVVEITVRNGTVVDCSAAGRCLYNDLYPIVRGDEGHNNLLHDLILERGVKFLGDGHRATRAQVGAPGFLLDWGHHGSFDRIDAISTSAFASIRLFGNGSWLGGVPTMLLYENSPSNIQVLTHQSPEGRFHARSWRSPWPSSRFVVPLVRTPM